VGALALVLSDLLEANLCGMGQPVQMVFGLVTSVLSAAETGWEHPSKGNSCLNLQVGQNPVALLARQDCLW